MVSPTNRNRIGIALLASLLGGGGAWLLRGNDEPHQGVVLAKRENGPSLKVPFEAQTSLPQSSTQTIESPLSGIHLSTEEELARYFYSRFQNAKDPFEKFDNIRWACGCDDINPKTLEDAAKKLGISKEDLKHALVQSANNLFQQPPPQENDTAFSKFSYWNNLDIAYKFTGIDEDGTFNSALAVSSTSRTPEDIKSDRNSHLTGATNELIPQADELIQRVHNIRSHLKDTGQMKTINSALEVFFKTMSLQEAMLWRDKLEVIQYAEDQGVKSSKTKDISDDVNALHNYLRDLISDKNIDAATRMYSVQGAQTPSVEPSPKL